MLVSKGLYDKRITEAYSPEELQQLAEIIVPNRDNLFTYIGLKTLLDRYVAKDFDNSLVELPQARWMMIAMTFILGNEQFVYDCSNTNPFKCRKTARTTF